MKKIHLLVFIVLLLIMSLLAGCGGNSNSSDNTITPTPEDEINTLLDQFQAAFKDNDLPKIANFASFADPGFTFEGDTFTTSDDFINTLKPIFDDYGEITTYELSKRTITVSGQAASVICRSTAVTESASWDLKIQITGVKTDSWKVQTYKELGVWTE